MAKGLRIGNKIYPDKIICDGCRGEIDINQEEIFCSKCRNNQLAYIKKLEAQLANIKYLNADEVEHIIGSININQEKGQAICNLAIDIDRDKIIEVLRKYFGEYNFGYLDGVTDQIIKAIRGEE